MDSKKYLLPALILIVSLLPAVALAQFTGSARLLVAAQYIVSILIRIVFATGLLVFLWGIVKYIGSAGDVTKAKEGKSIMTYGIIAMFVMAAIWGIVEFISIELEIPLIPLMGE